MSDAGSAVDPAATRGQAFKIVLAPWGRTFGAVSGCQDGIFRGRWLGGGLWSGLVVEMDESI
jgi:hypothetical protein